MQKSRLLGRRGMHRGRLSVLRHRRERRRCHRQRTCRVNGLVEESRLAATAPTSSFACNDKAIVNPVEQDERATGQDEPETLETIIERDVAVSEFDVMPLFAGAACEVMASTQRDVAGMERDAAGMCAVEQDEFARGQDEPEHPETDRESFS
eukprot:4788316-Prymnesium_polylepis.2